MELLSRSNIESTFIDAPKPICNHIDPEDLERCVVNRDISQGHYEQLFFPYGYDIDRFVKDIIRQAPADIARLTGFIALQQGLLQYCMQHHIARL